MTKYTHYNKNLRIMQYHLSLKKVVNRSHLIIGNIVPLLLVFFTLSTAGQENTSLHNWAGWMGAERGIWHLDLQKESLSSRDIKKVWESPVGPGYSGPTVFDGRVYLMDYLVDSLNYERILCINGNTGELLWSHQYERNYSVGYPTGPRASVLINEGRAYSLGTMGDLYCLDAINGDVIWYVNGLENYNIRVPVWGLSSSPVVEGEFLIVQIGGSPDACVVAFNKHTGKEVWRSLADEASYSTPIIIEQAGKRVLICWTGDNLVGLDPATGNVYWKIPYERSRGIINIATPVYEEPYIFLSSFWDGSMLIKLDQDRLEAELVWKRAGKNERNTEALHCCISTPIIDGDYVYGIDSYGEFRCLELLTGNRIWTDSTLVQHGRWANAHFVRQDEKTWAFNEAGELILAELSPRGFSELGRVELVKPFRISPNPRNGVNWAFPAFSGRRVYARSDALLVCFELIE